MLFMTGPMDMIDDEDRVFAELDRLLNDPEVPMQAARVWELLDKVAARSAGSGSA